MGRGLKTVNRYYDAWRKQGAGLDALLADDVTFSGPLAQWKGAKQFREEAAKMGPAVAGVEVTSQFENGDEVCSLVRMDLNTPAGPKKLECAEWVRVEGDRIAEIRLYYDPRELAQAMSA